MAEEVVRLILKARDEASAQVDTFSGTLGRLLGVAGKLNPLMLAGASAVVGAGVAAVTAAKQFADQAEQLDNLQRKTGVAIDWLQTYRRVVELAGGDPDSLTRPIIELNKAIDSGDPLLKQLGITTRDTNEAFRELVMRLAASSDTARVTAIANRLLGGSSRELIGHFKALADSSDDVHDSMRQTGELIEGDTLKAARALDTQMDRLDQNWRGSLARMQGATVPWVADMITGFNDLWDAISGNKLDTTGELDRKMGEVQRDIEKAIKRRDEMLELQRAGAPDYSTRRVEMIGLETKAIADLTKQIEDLARKRRELAGVSDIDRMKAIHGDEVVLPGLPVIGDSPREKRLRELGRILDLNAQAAAEFARSLDDIEARAQRQSTLEKLFGKDATLTTEGPPLQRRGIRGAGAGGLGVDQPVSAEELQRMRQSQREMLAAADSLAGSWAQARVEYSTLVAESLRGSTLMTDGIFAVQSGLDSALLDSIRDVATGYRGLEDVARDALRGIATEVEHVIEKMVALRIVTAVFGVPSLPVGPAPPGSPGASFGRTTPGLPAPAQALAPTRSGQPGATVINLNATTLDSRDLERQMLPGGKLYEAARRLNRGGV